MYVCVPSWMAWMTLPVSQRGNDKPFSTAQELILVDKAHVCDVDDHLVRVLVEVETTLLQPLKVVRTFDVESALEGERVRIMIEEEGQKEENRRGMRGVGGSKIKG